MEEQERKVPKSRRRPTSPEDFTLPTSPQHQSSRQFQNVAKDSTAATAGVPRTRTVSVPSDPPPYGLSTATPIKLHDSLSRKQHLAAPQSRNILPASVTGSVRSVSTGTPFTRHRTTGKDAFQPFSHLDATTPVNIAPGSQRSRLSSRVKATNTSRKGGGDESASESGASVLSAFLGPGREERPLKKEGGDSAKRRQTNSPLRAWARWMTKSGKEGFAMAAVVGVVLLVKCLVSLGSYSGAQTPPLRGDFEAQRHWLAMTSSALPSLSFLYSPSAESVPLQNWYSRDLPYWGLDYPPITAYHSFLLGTLARLSPRTAPFVSLRSLSASTTEELEAWDKDMAHLEEDGDMKSWMRATVLVSDAVVWIPAVIIYCRHNYGKAPGLKGTRNAVVAASTILLQPALLLVDNGHFQYNSVMLGLTLWSVNFFQSNHHLLGAICFVLSLGFKQMALYYSPAIFAYLLGRSLWLGRRDGLSFIIRLGFVTIFSFLAVFLPFLYPSSVLLSAIHRIFPFARGLFEDKVANAWCVLNVVVKLRDVASVAALAKLALLATVCAVLPGVLGLLWVSYAAGARDFAEHDASKTKKEDTTTPTVILLPHALFTSAMAFFLFSFQVHEKSILLPLMPLTLLMGGREAGHGRMDWEWAVLVNNVAVFSMWPLLKRDGLGLQYLVLTLAWNFAIGYNPISLRPSFVKWFSLVSYIGMLVLHLLELLTAPPAHLPDLFTVFNLTLSAAVFAVSFLWASKRSTQEGWTVAGGFGSG